MAGHKPVIPPKKPLPAQKKPKGLVKKPEKKVESAEDQTSVYSKKNAEDMKDYVNSKPQKDVISNAPAIKTDSAEEGTCTADIKHC